MILFTWDGKTSNALRRLFVKSLTPYSNEENVCTAVSD